jgi:hypothetical protein
MELVPASIHNLFPAGTAKQIVIPFSADFDTVPATASKNEEASRFIFGHPPSWEDLAGNLDIAREATSRLLIAVDACLSSADRILILADDTGTGKTTILRRVAFEFARRQVHVLSCSALSRLDTQRTAEAIDLIDGPVLIIVDNFADQAAPIGDIMSRVQKRDLAVLGAERRYRIRYVQRALSKVSSNITDGLELHFIEAERLLNLYLRLGMVGRPEATKNPNAFAKQIFRDPIAVAACRILNDFRPLERIVKTLIADSSAEDCKRYIVAALAQFCNRGGVRYEILALVSGRNGWDGQFETGHPMPLSYFYGTDRSFIVPLNSVLASRVLDTVAMSHPELLLDVFISLANAIAPRVNRATIKQRSPEARLAGRLFDYDQITRPFLGDSAPAFYSATREAWQWNSRYWEQVALMHLAQYRLRPNTEEGQDELNQAVHHARHAVAIETHPFTLTTLGRILMAQLDQEGVSRTATYEEAFDRLSNAIELERAWSPPTVHPFITLFAGSRHFLACGGKLKVKQLEDLRSFVHEARRSFSRDPDIASSISELIAVVDLNLGLM